MKHVIVTGASRGLGLVLANGLATSGYRVSTCSREKSADLDRLLSANSGRVAWFRCSVADAQDVDRLFEAAMDWAGADGLYALINNAGIAGEGVLATFPNTDSQHIVQVNLMGALHCARAALRLLLRQNSGGRIINISSIIGVRGYTGLAAYSASKAGVDGTHPSASS